LILEASGATSRLAFATSHGAFATSPVFAPGRLSSSVSLSKLLREKKKESSEGQEINHMRAPRVTRVLPSIPDPAYFLGHEFHGSETPESWQLMASEPFKINVLEANIVPSTCPRIALRVAPFWRTKAAC
jgi:hypothetical protein